MYKKRELEKALINNISKKDIAVILGSRQTGKTTLLKKIYDSTDGRKSFVDLDIFENKSIFSSYSEAMKYLKFEGYEKNKKFILFLDEFHKVKKIGKILKNIYDNNPEIKIYATGSSSIEIIGQLKESMAGRKRIFNLYPLSFEEYLLFKDEVLYQKYRNSKKSDIPAIIGNKLDDLIKEYCIFGGYPEVALEDKKEGKKETIRKIFDLFVQKDLINFLNIKNPDAAYNILKYIAINSGQIINYSDISNSCNVDINTQKRYINILNQLYIIKTIPPFYTNKKKEIVKAPKIYFYDPGVRNFFIKNFASFEDRNDNSFLLENYFFSQIIKKISWDTEIKYWRDKNEREVDFIIQKGNKINAYEIKNRKMIKKRDLSNLLFFKKSYTESKIYLLNFYFDTRLLNLNDLGLLRYYEI
ncbi:MAG TPA: ATP-binding protein [Candidatus Krumholzibacteriaceae bacterium]|nr:ATP-binding protein [Candidatus Krumholzibacteriaceae bacterium]